MELKIKEVYNHLLKFSDDLLTLESPVLDNRIEVFENSKGITLTDEFKYIIKKHNGLSLSGITILGIGDEFRASSLEKV